MTILIVDDDALLRKCLRLLLQKNGFQTLEARDGLEALELMREPGTGVDLVVSDVEMPKMGGIALARSVRAEFPATGLILTSGSDLQPRMDFEFLAKPFQAAELLGAIQCIVGPKDGSVRTEVH